MKGGVSKEEVDRNPDKKTRGVDGPITVVIFCLEGVWKIALEEEEVMDDAQVCQSSLSPYGQHRFVAALF